MSKTVKELANDAVATYIRKYPEFDVIASERDYLAGLIECALIEHEKVVREDDIEFVKGFYFPRTFGDSDAINQTVKTIWQGLIARKPADTEEPRLWFGISGADVQAGRHTKACYWNACHGAQVCTCEKEGA